MATMDLSTDSIEDYETFLRIRRLPSFRIVGHRAEFPDEYSKEITGKAVRKRTSAFEPMPWLFDYQRDISTMAVEKRKYCVFADCGLGKTLIMLEFARHCGNVLRRGQAVLIVCPLMVIDQTISESQRWYGDSLPIERVPSNGLNEWLASGKSRIGITNYEALKEDVRQGRLGALLVDESSMLKSHYGHYGNEILRLGAGLDWKLALTGTPAPNDRIEFANHACFMDVFKTTNEFLARYFINRGQTQNRWEIRPHAISNFYRDLSHWCIFLTNPATYGWKDNCGTIPAINIMIEHVELTDQQSKAVRDLTGGLFVTKMGGITTRQQLGRIAKGKGDIGSLKPQHIVDQIRSWQDDKQTLVWCRYNDEQDHLAGMMPDAGNIDGSTPHEKRQQIVDDFKAGKLRTMISKPKILGFGLNLQCASKMVFSTLQDSYEEYYQCIKRANRIGSTEELDVHIPVTEVEVPMIETVLSKADRIAADTSEQERLFKQSRYQ